MTMRERLEIIAATLKRTAERDAEHAQSQPQKEAPGKEQCK